VSDVERGVGRRYAHESYSEAEQEAIRSAIRAFIEPKAMAGQTRFRASQAAVARAAHTQQKLVQLHYKALISEEALAAEQERIETERAHARRLSAMATYEANEVFEALRIALSLVDEHVLWYGLSPMAKHLTTQAVFVKLIPTDADEVRAERQPLYEEMALVAEDLASGSHEVTRQIEAAQEQSRNDHDPDSRGHGSYFDQMAERVGFEPTRQVNPAHAISSRAP
jgi:hypothetical protein